MCVGVAALIDSMCTYMCVSVCGCVCEGFTVIVWVKVGVHVRVWQP